MSEIQPALLTQLELEWLLGKRSNLSKKTERDLRYRINRKLKLFMQTELPLLRNRGFAATVDNGAAAISSGSGTGEHSLVGRGIAKPGGDISGFREKEKVKERGEWDYRPIVLRRKFEPTRPFGHGISNPTPYQARRPPQFDKVFSLMY